MNICMVGYGAIAGKHMEALSSIEGVRPHVLVGRRPEPTAEFAEKWGFGHYTLDLEAALADDTVDAVVVVSPNDQHVPQAEMVLQAGKHLLLEIPIALNFEDSRRVTALSRRVDRRLMICHTMRYIPAIREVHRRVAEGRLRLHQIVAFFGLLRRTNTTWTGAPRSWTDNILWHHGAHLVDLAMWVNGCREATQVHCRFGPAHPTQKIMDMNLSMLLPGKVLVSISQSYNISSFRLRALFIGEEATLEFDDGKLLDGEGRVVVPETSSRDLCAQDQEFITSVREGRDPGITGEEVLPAMQVLQRAQASADEAD